LSLVDKKGDEPSLVKYSTQNHDRTTIHLCLNVTPTLLGDFLLRANSQGDHGYHSAKAGGGCSPGKTTICRPLGPLPLIASPVEIKA
jgi:hypothetical protein